ncbi:hypothetical protein FOZ60_013109, partial [Perkinsus olseni]
MLDNPTNRLGSSIIPIIPQPTGIAFAYHEGLDLILEDDLLGSEPSVHRLMMIEVAGNTPVKPRLAHGLTVVAAVEREAPTLSRNLSPYDITEALSALVGAFTPEAPATARATWWTPRVGKLKAKFQRAQWRYHRHKREHAPLRFITVREVTSAASAVVFGRAMTPAHRFRCDEATSPGRGWPGEYPSISTGLWRTERKHRKAFNRLMKAIMEHLDVTAAAQQD